MSQIRNKLNAITKKIEGLDAAFQTAVEGLTKKFDERKAALVAERDELQAKVGPELDTARIEQGTEVSFIYGRDKALKVGTVLGRGKTERGAELVRIITGSGLTAETVTVYVQAIQAIGPFDSQAAA
ncbi:MAG: hypothetical protein ACK5S6_01290 [bacterium]